MKVQAITKRDAETLITELRTRSDERGAWVRTTINRMFARWEDRVARNRGAEPTSRVCCGTAMVHCSAVS